MNAEQTLPATPQDSDERVRITIELSRETLAWIDDLRVQLGFRSRGIIIEQLLLELQPQERNDDLRQSHALRRLVTRITHLLKTLRNLLFPSQ
jgi:hypothetical protein